MAASSVPAEKEIRAVEAEREVETTVKKELSPAWAIKANSVNPSSTSSFSPTETNNASAINVVPFRRLQQMGLVPPVPSINQPLNPTAAMSANSQQRYDAENILSTICLRTGPAKKGVLGYKPPISVEEMEPVAIWFYMNGSAEPGPGPHQLPAPPHAPQQGELWVRGQKGPRKAHMGIFVGYCALDHESTKAREDGNHGLIEDLEDLKPKYAQAKKLNRRNVSIGDNVTRAGPDCVPLIDIPHERMYRVVAKCSSDVRSGHTPTGYFVLAKPDDNGVCEGFKPKGVIRQSTFWLPFFRDDSACTGALDRSEYQKARLDEMRRQLLGLSPRESQQAPAASPPADGVKVEEPTDSTSTAVETTPSPQDNRLSHTVVESIESDHQAESNRDGSRTIEPTSKKRKRQGDDAELSCMGSAMTALKDAKLSIEKAETQLQQAMDEKRRLLQILRNLGQIPE